MSNGQRDTGVTILSILALGYGLLGCICNPLSAMSQIMPAEAEPVATGFPMIDGLMNAVTEAQAAVPVWLNVTMALISLASWALSIMLITAAMGALSGKAWARRLYIQWGWTYIGLTVFAGLLQMIFVAPGLYQSMSSAMNMPEGSQVAMAISSVCGGLCSIALPLLFPAIILYTMTRPAIIASFEAPAPADWQAQGYGAPGYGPPGYGAAPGPYSGYPPQPGYQPPPGYPPPQGYPPPGAYDQMTAEGGGPIYDDAYEGYEQPAAPPATDQPEVDQPEEEEDSERR